MSYRQDVVRVFKEVSEEAADFGLRKLALMAYSTYVKTNPRKTGRSQNGYQMTIGAPSTYVPDPGADHYPPPEPVPEASRRAKLGDTIFIVDNVEYVGFLDEGSSDQAPAGMTALVIAQLEAQFGVRG